ncbi:ferrous iron transport protein A [Desulfohalobiaceae bacterium Ax17]|jgi:ferrous iron transport protein A|uniref:FeoA family protein n=1 Tax=Desulfovulcanus ferrireducens TaxID=2831190 RepID=UPI00207BCF29|nr:FeoA family protein [Desulfovulcanus ferrireducens]MBT8763477.1 ferrous iron transport protein A [Desulfovulcanus ferrireducens]
MSPKPIDQFPPGTRVKIVTLNAGCAARSKLCALGLIPGTEVVIDNCGCGPFKVKVRETDLVLGHGLAQKILCCPIS